MNLEEKSLLKSFEGDLKQALKEDFDTKIKAFFTQKKLVCVSKDLSFKAFISDDKSAKNLRKDLLHLCINQSLGLEGLFFIDILKYPEKDLSKDFLSLNEDYFLLSKAKKTSKLSYKGYYLASFKEDKRLLENGDLLLALSSKSLNIGLEKAFKALFKDQGLGFDQSLKGEKIIDILRRPNTCYLKEYELLKGLVKSFVSVGEGGIIKSLEAVLAPGLGAVINEYYLKIPELFYIIGKSYDKKYMQDNFDLGIALIMIVNPQKVSKVLSLCKAFIIGELSVNDKSEII